MELIVIQRPEGRCNLLLLISSSIEGGSVFQDRISIMWICISSSSPSNHIGITRQKISLPNGIKFAFAYYEAAEIDLILLHRDQVLPFVRCAGYRPVDEVVRSNYGNPLKVNQTLLHCDIISGMNELTIFTIPIKKGNQITRSIGNKQILLTH